MPLSDRINKKELSGILVNEYLTTVGELVDESLGGTGILSVGERGVDGYSPVITITPIESSEGKHGYILNIIDANTDPYGQDIEIWNGTSISRVEFNPDYTLTIFFDDGTSYTTDSIRGETGNSIESIVLTDSYYSSEDVRVDVYTIYFTDGNTTTYEVSNGLLSTDYSILSHKPTINNVELSGDLSLEDLNIQEQLTSENAGDGISISTDSSGKVIISNTNVSAEWGNIQGDITDQTDLVNYIEENGGKIDTISVNGTIQPIVNKNVDITIPTKTSDLTNDSNFVSDANYVHTDNNFTTVLKDKLDGIESGAQENVIETIKVNNVSLTVENKTVNIEVPTAISDLTNDSGFITNTVNDLSNYYLKSETYTKTEVNSLIGAISTLTIEVVQTLPTENISTTTIYLVPAETSEENNYYDEYIYVNNSWELIGTTKVDLSDYYTKSETNTLLNTKVDKVEGKGLSTEDFTTAEKTKLAGIEAGAEVNVNADWNATSGDAQILNKPTTISGYGITDAYTKTEVDNLLDDKQDILTAGTNIDITNNVISVSKTIPTINFIDWIESSEE